MAKIIETEIEGLFGIEPKVFGDERGYFFESFNYRDFSQKSEINCNWVQDNESFSQYGVIRGLHYQIGEKAQAKLVRVISGKVLDVVVDIRPSSKTFGKVFTYVLDGDKKHALYIPRGMAHGYGVLSEAATFFYKCDNYYAPEKEAGILWNDPALNIDWGIKSDSIQVSGRDTQWPTFDNHIPIAL